MRYFGKRVKNNRFSYTPRYYDPVKEDLKNRLRMASEESSPEVTKMRIQSGLKRRGRANKELEQRNRRRANIRLLVIIGFLVFAAYKFLMSDGIQRYIESISG